MIKDKVHVYNKMQSVKWLHLFALFLPTITTILDHREICNENVEFAEENWCAQCTEILCIIIPIASQIKYLAVGILTKRGDSMAPKDPL